MIDAKDLELRCATQFQALGDPLRLQIVSVLGQRQRCVCEIQAAVGPIAPNLLSYHLGILRVAGLVAAERRGRWVDYRLDDQAFESLRAVLPAPDRAQPAPGPVGSAPGCQAPLRRTPARRSLLSKEDPDAGERA